MPNTVLPSELTKTNLKDYRANFGTYQITGQYTANDYNGSLVNYVGASDIVNNSFTQKYLKLPLHEDYKIVDTPAMRATAMMIDTSKWKKFTGKYGEFAIGGPTIEMVVKSYNAVDSHTTKLGTYDEIVTSGSDANVGQSGYYVKSGTGSWTASVNITRGENVWCIDGRKKAYFMWIASPGNYNGSNILVASNGSTIGLGGTNSDNGAFRPLVAILKSTIQ